MHFEVLVEDRSGSIALDIALAKILGPNHTSHSWRVHALRQSVSATRRDWSTIFSRFA